MTPDHVILADLPCSVRGFCYHDDDGDYYIVLNSRLTRECNMATYDHENGHIIRGEVDDVLYEEYGGAS